MKESRENSQVKALYERAKKNKRLRTLVVALSVCVCLLTIGLLTKNAETLTIDTQYTDSELAAMPNFEQYIIGVTTQYKNKWDGNDVWHDLTPDTVLSKGNNEVKFQFDYVLSGGVLSNSNSVKYHLPDNLTITQRETGDVLNFYGQPVGSYLIDTDGLIVIEYNDEYVQRNRGGESIQGSLAFNTLVENIETGDDGSTQIHFKDNVVVNIETKEANEGKHDIKTVKSATSVDYANNTVSWKIDITSDNGTAEPVSVSDTMKEINITQGGNFVLKDKNGNTLNINNYGFSSTDKTFSLTLPQMAAGDKYTLEYVTKLDSTSSSGTVTTKNKVTVSSKDGRDRPIKDEHSVDKIVDKDILGKGGAISDDGQTISWTIEINPDGRDIGGGTINDTVLGQQLGYPDSTNFTVNINPPVNGQSQITFPFTFPAGTTQKYTITYSYPAYKQPGSQNIPNHVDFTWPNGDKENHDVSISAPPEYRPLDKHFVDKHLDGNGHATFDWTLNFNSNLGYMSPPTTIHDYVDGGNVDKQWFTYDQVEAVRAAVDSALSPYFSTGDYTFTPNFKFNGRYEGFDITFNVPIPMGVTFSINYQTTGTYVDGESNAYRNSAELKGVNNTVSTGDTKIEPTEPKVTKWDRRTKNQNDGSDTEHEYYDPNNPTMNGVMQWGVKLYIPENTTDGLTLNEFIPEDCVVQTNGLRVNAFNHDENITVTLSDDGQSYDVPRQTGNFYNRNIQYTIQKTTADCYETNANGDRVIGLDGQPIKTTKPCIQLILDENAIRELRGNNVYLYIDVKLKDNIQGWTDDPDNPSYQVKDFKNVVQVGKPTDDFESGDSQTQTIVKDKDYTVVAKTHDASTGDNKYANNEVPYRIDINPEKKDLDLVKDTVEIEDVMSFTGDWHIQSNPDAINLTLKPGSVTFTRVDDNGNETPLDPDEYSTILETSGSGSGRIYTMKATVPDEEHIVMRYVYIVSGPANYGVTLNNSASTGSITGHPITKHDKTDLKIQDSWAIANIAGTTIRKVDANDFTKGLSGAEFNILKWDSAQNAYVPFEIRQYNPADGTVVQGSGSSGADNTFITGENGEFSIQLAFNTAYQLTEVTPPSGYLLDPTPFYFYIENNDTVKFPMCLPANFSGKVMPTGSVIYYPDNKSTVDLGIQKVWFNGFGEKVVNPNYPPITCDLIRIESPNTVATQNAKNVEVKLFSDLWQNDPNIIRQRAGNKGNASGVFEEGTDVILEFLIKGGTWGPYSEYAINQMNILNSDDTLTPITAVTNPETNRPYTLVEQKANGECIFRVEYRFTVSGDIILFTNALEVVSGSITLTPVTSGETTQSVINTLTLNREGDWEVQINGLPRFSPNSELMYTYYIRENVPDGYRVEYRNNDTEHGVDSGKIYMANYPPEEESHSKAEGDSYVMPSTGGPGKTAGYVVGAMMMIAAAVALAIRRKKKG